MSDLRLRATLVPGDVGRETRLALWPDPTGGDELEVVVPSGGGVRRTTVKAGAVRIADVLDDLLRLGPDDLASASVRAWAQAARVAVELISKGRLQPSISEEGFDTWTIAPLTEHDLEIRAALAGWLPPEAHCLPIAGQRPLRITAPEVAMTAFYDAIADSMPRTAAAGIISQQRAWAGPTPADVRALRRHVGGSEAARRSVVVLVLDLPDDGDAPFRISLRLRSSTDASLEIDVADLWSGAAAGFDEQAEVDLLLALRRGARLWSPLERLLGEARPTRLDIDDGEGMALFGPLAGNLLNAGIEVVVPAAMTRTVRAAAHAAMAPPAPAGPADAPSSTPAGAPSSASTSATRFTLDSVCQLTWRATLDGAPVSDDELALLAASKRPMVRLRGEWVVVDPSVIAKLSRHDQITGADAVAAALGGSIQFDNELIEVQVDGPAAHLAERLRHASQPHDLPEPPGLEATLRPYQRRGLAWMHTMSDLGLGCVLADDMGLGKTVQLIALHLHRLADSGPPGPVLVVCPATLVGNWQRELERFAPTLRVHRFHGMDRSLDTVRGGDVVVTTYGIVRRDPEVFRSVAWSIAVADEAQQIKNPASATARAMRRLDADMRVALTGTPIENRLTELWAILDWTTPGMLGGVEAFRRNIALPIERDRDDEATLRFARVIAPFLLRRRKDDPTVVPDLPPRTITDHPVVLTAEQAGLYQAVVDETLEKIRDAEGMSRRGMILALITSLKQVCNHPAHYLRQSGPLAGRSAKLEAFDDLVTAISDAGDSTLVFTQYTQMGDLLTARLSQLGLTHRFLQGSVPLGRRTQMVDQFQDGEFPVFVLSLKAGGLGLNLTRATHVIHFDRWWNPAVENQASDRAWRIGQDRPVQIHRLVCEGTIEERIASMLAEKEALAEAVVGGGEAWITELDDASLAELVQLGQQSRGVR